MRKRRYGVKLTKDQIKTLWRHFQDHRPSLLLPHTNPEMEQFEKLFGEVFYQIGAQAARKGSARKKLAEAKPLSKEERDALEFEERIKAWRTPVRWQTLYEVLD